MPSRRDFLAGALASGGAVLVQPFGEVARASTAGAPEAKPRVVRRGRAIAASPRGHLLVVAHAQRRTVAIVDRRQHKTRLVELDGQPLEVAVSPDGRLAAVTTGFCKAPGLRLIDLQTRKVRRVRVGPAPFGVAFAPGGRRLVVSGGEGRGVARIVDLQRSAVVARVRVGRVPRGIAIGNGAWIALNGEAQVVRVDLRSGRVTKRLSTPPYPGPLAISPDRRRLLVGHRGGASELVLASGRLRRLYTGGDPSAVAYTRAGTRLIAIGDAAVVVSVARTGRRRRRRVDPGPRGLALAAGRAFTVSALTGAVKGVRA